MFRTSRWIEALRATFGGSRPRYLTSLLGFLTLYCLCSVMASAQSRFLATSVTALPVTNVAPPPESAPAEGASGPLPVVGGAGEPDYKYPWVVDVNSNLSCGGVLIHPRWVL